MIANPEMNVSSGNEKVGNSRLEEEMLRPE
jgi:hypothetical protein